MEIAIAEQTSQSNSCVVTASGRDQFKTRSKNMRMMSKPIDAKRNLLMKYLRDQGFNVARTHSGFVAVDEDGIVFTVSPVRTHVTIMHPVTQEITERRHRGQPDPEWFDEACIELTTWSKRPVRLRKAGA